VTGFRDPAWLEKERGLVRRVRAGDRAAFGELYEAFAGALFAGVLMPALGDPSAAEDGLADTFRTALERLDRFEDRGTSLWFWLREIAANKARDAQRAQRRSGRALSGYAALVGPLHEARHPEDEVGERQVAKRLREEVLRVLERIQPRYRRALELRLLEARPRQECADAMEVRLGTFDVVLLRALRAFRREWDLRAGARAREEVSG